MTGTGQGGWRSRRGLKRCVVLCALSVTVVGVVGCNRPLLTPDEARTPFDAYDDIRGQRVPQRITNEFGREQVNLRQRLAPVD